MTDHTTPEPRTGILWKNGDITMHANLEQTVMAYMTGRYMETKRYGAGVAKIMAFVDDKWSPLKMTEDQITLSMEVIDKWESIRSKK